MKIILASTSKYRQQLLQKLEIPFVALSPDINETPQNNESPEILVKRLAIAKAIAVSHNLNEGLIIGSDQVAALDNTILGKPGNFENALTQLLACNGKTVTFYTGLCVLNCKTEQYHSIVEPFNVTFRRLTKAQIETYLLREKPYDCAGSFKSEGLGITLFSSLSGRDPNTLVGLPLIALIDLLKRFDYDVLTV